MFYFLLLLTAVSSLFGAPTVALFNDTSAWYHWGCTGTSYALKEGIAKQGFEIQSFPINLTYALKAVPGFTEFDDKEKFELFCQENASTIEAIQKADAIVITGEGTIHDLRAGPRALLYLAHIAKTRFQKHVEIINHSAYPKDDPALAATFINNFKVEPDQLDREIQLAQTIYNKVYSEIDFVAIREPFSQEAMQKVGVSSELSFDCLPLYIRDHYREPKIVNENTLVVAGSVAFTDKGAEELCRYLEVMEKRGFSIAILTGAAAYPSQDDKLFIAHLKKHCKASVQVMEAQSLEEWLRTIQNARFLVSGRFHHSIAAFCLNTPFIALNSNTHKVHAICQVMDVEAPLHYTQPKLFEHLLLRTENILTSKTPENSEKISELCTLAENNFLGLNSLNNSKE